MHKKQTETIPGSSQIAPSLAAIAKTAYAVSEHLSHTRVPSGSFRSRPDHIHITYPQLTHHVLHKAAPFLEGVQQGDLQGVSC